MPELAEPPWLAARLTPVDSLAFSSSCLNQITKPLWPNNTVSPKIIKSYLWILALALVFAGCAKSPQEATIAKHEPEAVRLPTESFADKTLTTDVLKLLKTMENAHTLNGETGIPAFGLPDVVGKRIIEKPDSSGTWIEEWTIQRSGYRVAYTLKFIRSPQGGTDIACNPKPRRI